MIITGQRRISTIVLSTALGPDGRGIFPYTLWPGYRRLLRIVRETSTTVITKSATLLPRRGNFMPANPFTWKYIRRLADGGMLNAYGLTNKGLAVVAPEIGAACREGFQVIPNFWLEFSKGAGEAEREILSAAALYREHLGEAFWAVELNFSCPNVAEDLACNWRDGLSCLRALRAAHPDLFVIAKISIRHPYEFAQELERGGVGAIHAINTIPYELVFPPDRFPPSPLAKVGGGGVSGGPAFAQAYQYNQGLRPLVRLPLILGCGVTGADDVRRYLDIGAGAVSICTWALRQPGEVAELVRNQTAWFDTIG
jgi:dihydroorotate dehydrogenase|uniref:Dihydroorotate dehydrogenase catalytic domain-containing protein n=1 Tax=Desulfobacca acetoxidans TaxID=60893 RepID=A0A7V6A480_9BACT